MFYASFLRQELAPQQMHLDPQRMTPSTDDRSFINTVDSGKCLYSRLWRTPDVMSNASTLRAITWHEAATFRIRPEACLSTHVGYASPSPPATRSLREPPSIPRNTQRELRQLYDPRSITG